MKRNQIFCASLRNPLIALIAVLAGGGFADAAAEADLLVGYDLSHANGVGGSDNVEVRAANAIAGSNLINERCGTGAKVRIVGYKQSAVYNYQRTSNNGFVQKLASGEAGWVEDVKAAANGRGADLVAYICDSSADGAAAVAYQPGRESSFDGDSFWTNVVAHELGGHNYGCDHKDGHANPKTVMLHNYCGNGSQGWFSNRNIWLNGVQLLGGDSCLGGGPNGGDNSLVVSNGTQSTADRYARVNVAPNLANVTRRWAFNRPAANAPAGTTVTDPVTGTALATVQGNGAIFTGSGLRLPGGAPDSGAAYLQLPAGIISGNTEVTVEIWATPLSAPNWSRLADFNNGISNYLTLSSALGTDITAQRFESNVGGALVKLDSDLPTTAGVQHLYTITYTSTGAGTGRWQWYRDGDAIAYIDVAYALSALQDVNNWLGRSALGTDSLANCEYAEVRVSNVAMSRDEILSNFELGPNPTAATSSANLTADDSLGTTSFNVAGHWSDGLAPSAGKSYETYNFRLRTPADTVSRTFAGQSLKLTAGSLIWKGTASNTITVNDLTLNGDCELLQAGSGTWTLAGNLKVDSDSATVRGANGPINLTANLTGASTLLCVDGPVTLAGSNAGFAGKIAVGDGRTSSIVIDSEARLGPNPASLVTDQLSFNRGALTTTGTFSLDDPNRGILLGVNRGTFEVTSGTLTVTCPLYSPDLGATVVAGGIAKDGAGTLVLNSPTSTFTGTLNVDSRSNSSDDGIVRVMNNQVLANAHNPIFISNTAAGSSRLQLDSTPGGIALTRVSLAGRDGSAPAIQSLGGTNTIAGLTLTTGGGNHVVQVDSGLLNFTEPISSGVTGARTLTFQGNGDTAALDAISELGADPVSVVKAGNGTMTLEGDCTYNGTTTLSGGTLRLNGSLTTTTGATTTAAGTTFAGSGPTGSPTTIGGIHAPGNSTNSTGTQTFTGTLAYGPSASVKWTLAANATAAGSCGNVSAQAVTVSAGAVVNLVFNGPGSAVNFNNSFWTQPRSWAVVASTAMSGQFALGTVSADSAGNPVSGFGTISLQQTSTGATVVFYPLTVIPPAAPTGLSGTGSPGTVTLAWTASPDASSYNVKRSTSPGGPYETIATGIAGTTFYDTSAANDTTYYYVVTSVTLTSESAASAEVSAAPHLPATITKANNTIALNLPASWTGGLVPKNYDTARWTGLAGANSVLLGSNTAWKGIVVGTTGGAVTIGAGNTLSLGTGGIDMSAATQNLTIASALTLGTGNQTWNVATGRTFTATGTFTRSPGSTLVVDKSVNTGAVTASLALTHGIVGPWGVVKSPGTAANNSANGFTYATVSAGKIVPFTTATASGFNWTSSNNNTFNYDVSGTTTSIGINRGANTIRYTGAAATQNYGSSTTATLTVNGLMNAGSGLLTLSQTGGASLGQVVVGTNNGNELDLIAANAGITIAIPILNNGATPGSVAIAGTQAVRLDGANTYSGGTTLNSGDLQLGSDSVPTSGTVSSGPLGTGPLAINGGLLTARSATNTVGNAVTVNSDFTLNGTAAGTSILTLTGPVDLAGGIRVVTVAADNGAVLSGTISNGSLTKAGASALTLSGANTYAGGTTLAAGTLQLGHVSALGAATGSLTVDGGTLDLNGLSPSVGALSGAGGTITSLASGTATLTTVIYSDSTFAGALQDGAAGQMLALNKQGAGTLTIAGTSSHSGATTVGGGTLAVNGSFTGGSSVAVNSGSTLAGTGSISGPVTVAANGTLAPGTPTTAGVLTVSGGLTLNNGSVLYMKLATTGASSRIALGGTLNATGVTTIHLAALGGFGPGVYPLITGATPLNALSFALGSTPPGYSYALSANAGTLSLTVTAPPAAPTGLAATGITSGISLSWSAAAGADSYTVKRSTTSGSGYQIIASGLATTSYTDAGLAGGATYYYVVSAVNPAGSSGNSTETSGTALPPAPVITSAGSASGTVGVAFSYQIIASNTPTSYGATGLPAGLSVNATSGVIGGTPTEAGTFTASISASNAGGTGNATLNINVLPPAPVITSSSTANGTTGVAFTYQIAASNSPTSYGATGLPPGLSVDTSNGSINGTPTESGTFSTGISATNAGGTGNATLTITVLRPVPAAPAGLTAAGGHQAVALNWTASSGATSYNVKRSTTSGSGYATVATGVVTTTFNDTGLTNGTTYYYVVSAVNAGGESSNSTQASATPKDLIAWWKFDETSGTTAADSAGTSNGTLAAAATWSTGWLNNSVALDSTSTSYASLPAGVVSTLNDFSIASWVYVNANSTWARIFDFGTGTNVYMMLSPASSSNTVRYSISNSGSSGQQQINSPAILSPGVWHHVAVTLSGSTGTLYIDGAAVGTNNAMTLKPSSLGITTQNYIGKSQYPDPYLNGNVDDFRIYNRALSGAEVSTLASAPTTQPGAPTGLNAVAVASNRINLAWTASSGATSYNVKRATVSGGPYTTVANVSTTSSSDSTLTGSTTYYYVVSAMNAGGESADSAPASATTPASPPSPWIAGDIGSVGVAGSATYNGGTYTLEGSGADISGTADAFQSVSQTLAGDGEIRARVTSQTNADPWAKAGVMIRDGSGSGAVNALIAVTPSNGFTFQSRSTASGTTTLTAGPALNAAPNNWVRLTRSGTLITAYVSANGTAWTQVSTATLTMGTNVSIGLSVTSHNNSVLGTATFDNVSVTPYPSPWLTADIGSTGLAGSTEYYGSAYTVKGAGTFGGTTDGFRYVYQTLSADGSIVARVSTLQNTGTSARVGVMMRDALASNSRMASLTVTGAGAWRWQRRTLAGGTVSTTNSSTGTAPSIWVRLVRSGSTVTASRSTDGTSWTTIGSATITMASNCYIGLAVASGSTTTLNTSIMDNLIVIP